MTHRATRRGVLAAAIAAPFVIRRRSAAMASPVVLPDGRSYDAYLSAASKPGQWHPYTCEFDAAWAVLKSFGRDVPLDDQLAIVGHDTSIEPTYAETPEGVVIQGGEIGEAYSGDYVSNFLARSTGRPMARLFAHHGLGVVPVSERASIEAALLQGALVWAKVTVDFKDWVPATWVTPTGLTYPTVLGNDHAAVVMGFNASGVVIRDVLGPTSTNWERPYEYDVPWARFLEVLAAQGGDALAVGSGLQPAV